jgi:UDP-3-O-acyl-N-acetylglucosamine deacetylase
MTEGAPKDELTELTEHYERIGDEDLLAEWERGEAVAIEVREPMVSRSIRFPRSTFEQLCEIATARGIGVTQLIREWTEQRLAAGGDLDDRIVLADELERAARLLRESA